MDIKVVCYRFDFLFIVDDEISAIEAVQKGILWEKFAVTSVYTALSMKEAIEQLSQYPIDIMLCDIEMPMGTGLELLLWKNENKPNVIYIFMTCHAAVGYNVLWGFAPDKLYHSYMVFGSNEVKIGALVKGQQVYVRVGTFNEKGITEGKIFKVPVQ